MAIAGIPTNFTLQTGNQQNYLLWDLTVGATSYSVQRSTDGVNYTTLATPVSFQYLDSAVTIGVQYWYQVASVNISGTSPYCSPLSIIPAPTAEMSLAQIRYVSQQKADRVNSDFVTNPEWNTFINLAAYELYDLLIDVYEDYYIAPPVHFTVNGSQSSYTLPDGTLTFQNQANANIIAAPFYKLMGVDLSLNSANNAYVTVDKFNFMDRNRFVYPNTASTIYGVFNLQYRVLGNQINFIPTPSANQIIQLWYIPRLPQLLQETDLTTIGVSGWLQYVIVRAAKYALDKEESDTTKLDMELAYIKTRVEEAASNRDAGRPDRVTDVRQNGQWGSMSGGYGANGPLGGF